MQLNPALAGAEQVMETTHQWEATERQHPSPLKPLQSSGIELTQLSRYAFIAALFAVCAMLSTWSRIDLRETAVALDIVQSQHTRALSERARLELELASLSDPLWLQDAASSLSLQSDVPVIDVVVTE